MKRIWCKACLWIVLHWPWSCFNRMAWPVYLWLLPWAGEEAYRDEVPSR